MNNHLITEDDYYYEYMQMSYAEQNNGRLQMSLQNKITWKPCCRS